MRHQLNELEQAMLAGETVLAEQLSLQQKLEAEKECLSVTVSQLQKKMEDADQHRQTAFNYLTDCEWKWHQLHTKVAEGFGFTSGMKQALQEEPGNLLHSFWDVFEQVPPA